MLPEFTFTLPACGKELTWKPLAIGASLDTTAANTSTPIKIGPELLLRRIIRYDGREGPPKANEWREWEEGDYEALADEILEKEGARKAMFRKKRAGVDLDGALKSTIIDCQQAAAAFGRALTAVLEAYEAQKASHDPLGSGAT